MELDDSDRAAICRLASTFDMLEADITTIWQQAMAAGAERCAQAMNLSRSEAQLMAGEMTLAEWRAVSAVLVNRAATCRALAKG